MSDKSALAINGNKIAAECGATELQGANTKPSGGVSPRLLSDNGHSGRCRIPPKLYRIGEVIEYSGVSRQTIHNYTTMGLLHECRWTPGGHRLYDESVFERLDRIAELKARKKSLEQIRKYFAGLDSRKG